MSAVFPRRHRTTISLLIVALWLGWTGMGLTALGRGQSADPAVLVTTLERIPASVRHSPVPTAVWLKPFCSCTPFPPDWPAIGQVLAGRGGNTLELAPEPHQPDAIELLVFDGHGQVVYSGPLSPPPGACGQGSTAPGDWLPALIDGRQPPLHLGATPCHC